MGRKKDSYIIGICIILSRLAGLLREVLLARYLGASELADIFRAGIRIPNFLQNLLGEGVLSSAFIPTYKSLKNSEEEKKLSLHCLRLLSYLVFFIALTGVFFPEYFVSLLAPGFSDSGKIILSQILIIIFPGTALLVISAWCLSILNSNGYFSLSYSAPLAWNFTIIFFLLYFGGRVTENTLLTYLSYSFLIGSFMQLIIQLPKTISITGFKNFFSEKSFYTTQVLRNIIPVIFSRGVVQISAYLDTIIASFLAVGSLSILSYAQILFLFPFSVFGMSIAASELPSMSEIAHSEKKNTLAMNIVSSTERILFFVIPTIFCFLILGKEIISFAFLGPNFREIEVELVWLTLLALSIGLIPSCLSRLYSSALYALQYHSDVTKISIVRVLSSLIISLIFCFHLLPSFFSSEFNNLDPSLVFIDLNRYIVIGIGLASGISSWIEFIIIKKSSNSRMGEFPSHHSKIIKLLGAGLFTSIVSYSSLYLFKLPFVSIIIFCVSYLAITSILGFEEFDFKKLRPFRRSR